MAEDPRRYRAVVDQMQDPFLRRSLKAALHVRRFLPFYVFALVGLLALGIFPTVQNRGGDDDATQVASESTGGTGSELGPDANTGDAGAGAGGEAGAAGPGGQAAGAVRQPGTGSAPPKSVQQSLAAARNQTGKTKGGIDCRPGVKQLPDSTYSAPCTALFTGNNGGVTSPGITDKEIIIVRRGFADSPNSQAVDAVVAQAGGATAEDSRRIRDVFIGYFEKMFELYGRRVKYIDYESEHGNSTDEALSQGKPGACADATAIKSKFNPFAVIGGKNTTGVSSVFAECAADKKIMTFGAAAYYPESWYRSLHPYAWNGVMECERISYQLAEYIGKRLGNKKARWAKDPLLKESVRKFATYVPDNDGYQSCVNIAERKMQSDYGIPKGPRYNYQLDVSRFPSQAAEAIVKFKAENATTIILACDPISTIFLTQAAARNQYWPEWVQIGTALNDVDNAARLFDQDAVENALFGPSQLGAGPKLFGDNSEPGRLYTRLTGQKMSKFGATDGGYWGTLGLYNMFQMAGPLVTPIGIAEALFTAPPSGAPDFAVGYISYQDSPDGRAGGRDHTGIDDSREIYWMRREKSVNDGKEGTYIETYGGRRFRNGEWPKEDPPIYPGLR
jgi:hypothetical protein